MSGTLTRSTRAFVVLSALQLLPLGLLVPVEVLVMQARGLTAAQVGLVIAVLAVTTAALELPTGGLADVVGRRAVLLGGAAAMLAALLGLAVADGLTGFLLAGVLFAVGRALESGPLEAWFVDAVHDELPVGSAREEALTRGLGRGGAASLLALAAGSVAGGFLADGAARSGLPAEGDAPLLALSVPLLVAAGLVVLHGAGLVLLMSPHPHPRQGAAAVVRGIGPAMTDAARLASADAVLRLFLVRWLLVPTGFLAFELVTPIRLAELLPDPARAAAVLGVVVAGCLAVSGATSALAPLVRRLAGALPGAGACTVLAGAAFALAGPTDGAAGLAVLVLALVVAHAAAGPLNGLVGPFVHARVPSSRRATLLSLEAVVANVAVALGAVLLGVVVQVAGTPVAFAVAGALTALAALPLVGVARQVAAERAAPAGADRSQTVAGSADSAV